jgi:hypothetical protein
MLGRSFRALRQCLPELPEEVQTLAGEVLERGSDRLTVLREALPQDLKALRIRCHGNFGLWEVLCHADDLVIIDFEGDPDWSISQRRAKASPLRDVAGMLWSFERAALTLCATTAARQRSTSRNSAGVGQWVDYWLAWTGAEFLRAYLAVDRDWPGIPRPRRALEALLDLYHAERCTSVLEHDVQNRSADLYLSLRQTKRFLDETRPDWGVSLPCHKNRWPPLPACTVSVRRTSTYGSVCAVRRTKRSCGSCSCWGRRSRRSTRCPAPCVSAARRFGASWSRRCWWLSKAVVSSCDCRCLKRCNRPPTSCASTWRMARRSLAAGGWKICPYLRRRSVEGVTYTRRLLALPGGLPWGYHRLDLEVGGQHGQSLIIAAPLQAYAETRAERQRLWGVFLPLYALQRQSSRGAGTSQIWKP